MAYSEDNIQQFFTDLLAANKQKEKSVKQLADTTDKLLAVEVKSLKADKKEQKKEQQHKNRLAQLAARKEKDQKGPLQEMFAKDKQSENKLNGWLLAALGIGAAGLGAAWLMSDDPTAKKIRDEIGKLIKKGFDFLKEELKKAIDKAIADLDAFLRGWANDQFAGTGLGTTTTPGGQEAQTEAAEGTRQEKMDQLREEMQNSSWVDKYITGAHQERIEQLYYLEAGEVMQYGDDFRLGGGGGKYGRSIVSGDVTQIREQTAGVSKEDKARLKELDTMIRDRREFNDRLAKMPKEDDSYNLLVKKLREKEEEIGQFYSENEALTKMLEGARDKRLEKVNNPVQKQTGGIINVPGYGDGDKVPMLLPPQSFVLNKKASKHYAQKRQTGGSVGYSQGIKFQKRRKGGQVGDSGYAKSSPSPGSVSSVPGGNVNALIKAAEGASAKRLGKGKDYQCANTTRAVLRAAGHPSANKVTKKGDLDSAGMQWVNPHTAAGFAGTDMGPYTRHLSSLKPGMIVLWKNTFSAMGGDKPGAITHVGIKGKGNDVYHHSPSTGFRKAPMFDGGKFAFGIKLTTGHHKVGHKRVGTGNKLVDMWNSWTGRRQTGGQVGYQEGGLIPSQKTKGPIIVPGSGDGDKVPMLLPSGSFVLNRKASQHLQTGGVVGAETSHQRFMDANSSAPTMVVPPPKTVVVKRRAQVSMPSTGSSSSSYNMGAGSSVNIVETASQLHRIQSGAAI